MASIYRRKSGNKTVWAIQYRVAGRRYARVVGASKEEAEAVLREVTRKLAARDPILDARERHRGKISVTDYCREYLSWSHTNKTQAGYDRDRTILGLLEGFLAGEGCRTLSEVGPLHLERYKTVLRARGTVENANRHLHTIRHAFGLAVHLGYLKDSPMTRVREIPVQVTRPPRYFSLWEIQQILWAALIWDEEFYRTVLFLASTGARISELQAIGWDHVDLGKGYVRLPTRKRRGRILWRSVPLSETLAWVLAKARGEGRAVADTTETRRKLQRLLAQLGIPHASVHTLRHTFASHLVSRGVSLYVVGKLLGHTNPQTTQVYAHLVPEAMEVVRLLPW